MGVAIFFVLTVAVSAILIYPLLPGRAPAPEDPALADGEIDQLVRNLRLARGRDGLTCPTCGTANQPDDRYCGRCGNSLAPVQPAPAGPVCPSCGSVLRDGDLFCAKCGHEIAAREAT